MAATTRPLPSGLQDAIKAQYTRPFYLLRADFPAPYGTRCFSSGIAMSFEGNTYAGDSCAAEELSWDGDAVQSGRIVLYNDSGDIAAMLIESGISEVAARLYLVYLKGDDSPTTPVLVAAGTLTDSDIEGADVTVVIEATSLNAQRIPNRFVTKQEGFNWLPVPGSQIQWGDEIYIFEEEQ